MKPLPPNTATILIGTPLPRTMIGAIRHDAADRRVAGADLLGDIDAAAADREAHIQPGFGEIAFALGELDRPERRKHRRRRKQIRDAFGGKRCASRQAMASKCERQSERMRIEACVT